MTCSYDAISKKYVVNNQVFKSFIEAKAYIDLVFANDDRKLEAKVVLGD